MSKASLSRVLLLSLVVVFSLAAAIWGTVLKYTVYRDEAIEAPGIAFCFLAMQDGVLFAAPEPVEPEPVVPEPVVPVSSAPVSSMPVSSAPVSSAPVSSAPVSSAPVSSAPVSSAPVSSEPVSSEPVSSAPVQNIPVSSMPGFLPVGPVPGFVPAPEGYFEDALFIGDSRFHGLRYFAPPKGADFFTYAGMAVRKCLRDKAEVDGLGEVTLAELFAQRSYKKIYLSFGVNDVCYPVSKLEGQFREVYQFLRTQAPDAVIYLVSSMQVTKARAEEDPIFLKETVDAINTCYGSFADNIHSFYLDINPLFTDETGYLDPQYTGDQVHLYAKHYKIMRQWLADNTVPLPDAFVP